MSCAKNSWGRPESVLVGSVMIVIYAQDSCSVFRTNYCKGIWSSEDECNQTTKIQVEDIDVAQLNSLHYLSKN